MKDVEIKQVEMPFGQADTCGSIKLCTINGWLRVQPGEYVKSIREGYDAASCYRYCSEVAHIHIVLIAIPANLR